MYRNVVSKRPVQWVIALYWSLPQRLGRNASLTSCSAPSVNVCKSTKANFSVPECQTYAFPSHFCQRLSHSVSNFHPGAWRKMVHVDLTWISSSIFLTNSQPFAKEPMEIPWEIVISGSKYHWKLQADLKHSVVFAKKNSDENSLLAEASFPLHSLSWRTGRKGTSAMGRNSLWFNRRPWSWTAVSETHAPCIVCWPWLEPTVSRAFLYSYSAVI